jgi:hypothetical protein
MPGQTLDADTYLQKLVDGKDTADVRCSVQRASSSFSVEGSLTLGSKSLVISNGTLGANNKGTARITLSDGESLSGSLSAPSANCLVDAAAAADTNYRVDADSIWAYFSCPSVERAPSDYCQAEGYFVLENCE